MRSDEERTDTWESVRPGRRSGISLPEMPCGGYPLRTRRLPCRSLRHLPVRPGRLFLRGSVKGGGSPKSALRPFRRPGVTCERVPKPGRDTGFTERGLERGVPFRLRQSALSLRPGCAHQRFPLRLGGGTKCLTWRDFELVGVYLLICDWTVRNVADGLSVCLPGRIIAYWSTACSHVIGAQCAFEPGVDRRHVGNRLGIRRGHRFWW